MMCEYRTPSASNDFSELRLRTTNDPSMNGMRDLPACRLDPGCLRSMRGDRAARRGRRRAAPGADERGRQRSRALEEPTTRSTAYPFAIPPRSSSTPVGRSESCAALDRGSRAASPRPEAQRLPVIGGSRPSPRKKPHAFISGPTVMSKAPSESRLYRNRLRDEVEQLRLDRYRRCAASRLIARQRALRLVVTHQPVDAIDFVKGCLEMRGSLLVRCSTRR